MRTARARKSHASLSLLNSIVFNHLTGLTGWMIAFQKEMFLLHVTEVGLDEVAGLAMMAQE